MSIRINPCRSKRARSGSGIVSGAKIRAKSSRSELPAVSSADVVAGPKPRLSSAALTAPRWTLRTKINQVRNQLPPDSETPIVTVSGGEFEASMYLAFASEVLAPHQVTDYLVRAVRPQLESIDGVQQAQIIGAQEIAMRIWLDPQRLTVIAKEHHECLPADTTAVTSLHPAG